MPESLREFFASDLFMPHGHCYFWRPALVWLQVLSNGFIALAYFSISFTLAWLVYRIRDIPFRMMYVAFGLFIVTCGITHLFDVWVIWYPTYWLDGTMRAITALASVGTALALPPLVPKAVALAHGAKAAHDKGLQLETVVKDLGTLYERTRELEQLKTQFFANVSHELRTPLALILGAAERLHEAPNLTDEQRRDLEVISRSGHLLTSQVNDLLDVSKLESGEMKAEYAESDVALLVRLVASNFESLARRDAIAYTVQTPEQLPGQVDEDKLQRILLNLLSNAFKFTPAGGRIRCTLRTQAAAQGASQAVLEVSDSGPGVRPEHRELIFERFRQVEGTASRRFGGTGLGLAIVKDFVALHGGRVTVGEAPEGGALFTVELPLAAPANTPVRRTPAPERPALAVYVPPRQPGPAPSAQPLPLLQGEAPLVLVVEDNVEMNRFVCDMLASEYRVASALNGREGLAQALALRPDLLLCDLMMPEMSGEQLVYEARARAELKDVPILLLTARVDDELRARLLREGAQDYVMKPFSTEELRARVRNQVTLKRTRDMLQRELESQSKDLEALAGEVTTQRRELRTLLEAMRLAREHAERASQVKSEFLAMVSHELRTPVAAIHLQIERLLRERDAPLPERQQQLLQRMRLSVSRLTTLIESLLDYTRIQSGRLTVQSEPFELRTVASDSVEELRPQAEQKGLELRLTTPEHLPPLRSDPRLVRLILTNLVANAIKFTPSGSIEVSLRQEEGAQVVSVRDTGPGIAPEHQTRVFEPFEQLEPVARKHLPGIGLGLALVREMTTALGGRVTLQSRVGEGSTFSVFLPEQGPEQGAEQEPTRPAPPPPRPAP